MDTFLDETELARLTGRKFKSKQIVALRSMGLPFFINAIGKPVVSRTTIDGKKNEQQDQQWVSRKMRS